MRAFDTTAQAVAAGYRAPSKAAGDKDVSGPNSFGYVFVATDGQQTVTVTLRQEKNKIGSLGAYAAMFPPKT